MTITHSRIGMPSAASPGHSWLRRTQHMPCRRSKAPYEETEAARHTRRHSTMATKIRPAEQSASPERAIHGPTSGLAHATVAPGFEAVRAAFTRNFARRREIGAAGSVYHRGRQVVDLWGGVRDRETHAAWDEATMALVFSTTKGL